jgi:Flp pilus assembly protein TadG
MNFGKVLSFLPSRRAVTSNRTERGQALVLFVLSAFILIGGVALVTDVSWLWYGQQRMQRAADAAALAGAIYLPGDPTSAYNAARNEATKNGFVNGSNGVTVTPLQDPKNRRRLIVTVSGSVNTYFARVFGAFADSANPGAFSSFNASATSRAEYVLPVPMGSPENYYGVGYFVEPVTTTETNTTTGQSDWRPMSTVAGGNWTNPGNVISLNTTYATASANDQLMTVRNFGLGTTSQIPNQATLVIDGLRVRLSNTALTGSGTSTDCHVHVELSWDGGTSWSTQADTGPLTGSNASYTLGSSSSTAAWGGHNWVRNDFSDTNFRLRMIWHEGNAQCAATRDVRVDFVEVRVDWHYTTTTTTLSGNHVNIQGPQGQTLNPQNFWGSMQSQGAPSIQGDAYMTKYAVRTGTLNGTDGTTPDARYAPDEYYNYAVEIPPGASNGEVWIFDPGFCDAKTAYGTGEYWTIGGANGNASIQPISAYFDLYDSNNTPYDLGDDSLVASSGDTFERKFLSDHEVHFTPSTATDDPASANDCQGTSWHYGWWQLAGGLNGGTTGRTFRLHSHTTDPDAPNDQNSSTALNGFSFFSRASGGTPRIYGIGAMEAYIRLPQGVASSFYMAQIEKLHAGKTMVIDLWDPGDTGNLSAVLEILKPTDSSYVPSAFDYQGMKGTTASAASDCNSRSGTGVTSVTTNTGGTSLFNGCWLTITINLPNDYDAPHPSSDTITNQGGWWKIRYNMGSGSGNSTDLTTWQVSMRGSPVHLVIP